jgi:hypothetical protein
MPTPRDPRIADTAHCLTGRYRAIAGKPRSYAALIDRCERTNRPTTV